MDTLIRKIKSLFKGKVDYKAYYETVMLRNGILERLLGKTKAELKAIKGDREEVLERLEGHLCGVRDELGRKVTSVNKLAAENSDLQLKLTEALESREAIAQVSKINNEERVALSIVNEKLVLDRDALIKENKSLIIKATEQETDISISGDEITIARKTLKKLKQVYLSGEKELEVLHIGAPN